MVGRDTCCWRYPWCWGGGKRRPGRRRGLFGSFGCGERRIACQSSILVVSFLPLSLAAASARRGKTDATEDAMITQRSVRRIILRRSIVPVAMEKGENGRESQSETYSAVLVHIDGFSRHWQWLDLPKINEHVAERLAKSDRGNDEISHWTSITPFYIYLKFYVSDFEG